MEIKRTSLEGCLIIRPKVFEDNRGLFFESFNLERYKKKIGVKQNFVQDNHSHSIKGVLRGLHYQKKNPQAKLVRVIKGEVFDVAVDIRRNSNTFGKWISVILNEKNHNQLWIPEGFAHGFLVLSDIAIFEYKCTNYYDPKDQNSIIWNDPTLKIKWPINSPILSSKDKEAPTLKKALIL